MNVNNGPFDLTRSLGCSMKVASLPEPIQIRHVPGMVFSENNIITRHVILVGQRKHGNM